MLVLRGAPPAQGGIQILGALVGHVSVIMQRQFHQFVEFFVPPVQFLDRMVDIPAACRFWYAQCKTVQQTVDFHRYSSLDGCGCACCCAMTGALVVPRRIQWSLCRCSGFGRRPVLGQGCCARWCNDWGPAQCLSRRWIHVLHHPGWLLEEFYDFLRDWVSRLLKSILRPARRRQRQWHVPHWFCWY